MSKLAQLILVSIFHLFNFTKKAMKMQAINKNRNHNNFNLIKHSMNLINIMIKWKKTFLLSKKGEKLWNFISLQLEKLRDTHPYIIRSLNSSP